MFCAKSESIQFRHCPSQSMISHNVAQSKTSYLAQDNSRIDSVQNKSLDEVGKNQYGDQLLNTSLNFAFCVNRSYYIFFLPYSKRISVCDVKSNFIITNLLLLLVIRKRGMYMKE